MIKFEHTLFALPFAFLGAVLAANGLPTGWQILWITVAMFGARSAAMTFNRIIDRKFDAENPRTAADLIFVMETRTSGSQNVLVSFIFWSRWLQAPLYVGLIVAQSLLVRYFLVELKHLAMGGVDEP